MEYHRLAHKVLNNRRPPIGRFISPAQQARILEGNTGLFVILAILFTCFFAQLNLYSLGHEGRILYLQRVFDTGFELPAVLLTLLSGHGHACVDARLFKNLILRYGEKTEQK